MRFLFSILITCSLLLFGCATTPPAEEKPAETKAPAADKPFVFVSDPAMKALMAEKVEVFSETLWNAGLEETAPKKPADWKKLEDAANGMVDAGKSMLNPPLSKDEGKWKEETQKFLDFSNTLSKAAKDKNLMTLNDTSAKMLDETCSTCHKLYYTGPQ